MHDANINGSIQNNANADNVLKNGEKPQEFIFSHLVRV
jgi:hypothetical protein